MKIIVLLFGWITKPYMLWNFIDYITALFTLAILGILIMYIAAFILYIKDKLKGR